MNSIFESTILQCLLIFGAIIYLIIIFAVLKNGKLAVKYAIIWIISGILLLLLAVFPYPLLVLSNILNIVNPSILVYLLVFVCLIFNTLALSVIVSGFSRRITRLIQTIAILEKRVRELEKENDNEP